VFDSIVEPSQMLFTLAVLDAEGKPLFEVETSVTLAPTDDGKTLLTLRTTVVRCTPQGQQYTSGMDLGWTQTLDRLASVLGPA